MADDKVAVAELDNLYAVKSGEIAGLLRHLRAQVRTAEPDALLPRLWTRHRAQTDRRGAGGIGAPGQDHPGEPGGLLGICLLLLRHG